MGTICRVQKVLVASARVSNQQVGLLSLYPPQTPASPSPPPPPWVNAVTIRGEYSRSITRLVCGECVHRHPHPTRNKHTHTHTHTHRINVVFVGLCVCSSTLIRWSEEERVQWGFKKKQQKTNTVHHHETETCGGKKSFPYINNHLWGNLKPKSLPSPH